MSRLHIAVLTSDMGGRINSVVREPAGLLANRAARYGAQYEMNIGEGDRSQITFSQSLSESLDFADATESNSMG